MSDARPATQAQTTTAEDGLRRGLSSRQLTMIAIGSAIGVGLFLGSTVTIRLAGPGVIVAYLIGAAITLVMAYALAEMAVVHPQAGSFGVYADRYLSAWSGFIVRATYGFIQIIAIGAEVTAVGIYFAFWFPAVPAWMWVTGASALLLAVNAADVRHFGEVEYWFSLIKVVAIVVFIGVGLALITGVGPWPATGVHNLTDGGFLPFGWTGVWLSLTLVITSYMGIEVIAVTAGEAQDPRTAIPRAMRTMVLRLVLFYVLAVTVMLAMTPWSRIGEAGSGLTGSPFVRAFATVGIPYAATLMNLVVISAALSSANANLYLTSRMLFSLARSGYAPAWLSAVNAAGVPRRAVLAASVGMVAAILLAIYAPAQAFLMLYGLAVSGMLFIWIIVLVTYLRFRQALSAEALAALPIRLPAARVSAVCGILVLAAIVVTSRWVAGLEYSALLLIPFLVLMSIVYLVVRRRAHA